MSDDSSPPPFVIGQAYWDRLGEYVVTAFDGDRITIKRPDGSLTIENAIAKARIHRNVVADRNAARGTSRSSRTRQRRDPTRREKGLMERILQLEADGADHSGVEIDRLLAAAAGELGYSQEDLSRLNPKTGRSAFANEGDWAKATMTEDKLHEVVRDMVHWEGGKRRQCCVYRITSKGLGELRKRG
jgi:hypothetical protein